jgi:DNA-directed RNA polymerase subunit E'/Rpb7
MYYPKEVKDILKNIPKEYHKDIEKILKFYFKSTKENQVIGAKLALSLLKDLSDFDPEKIVNGQAYVCDGDQCDGG